jgi:predicted transposase YbfD/YdcC
LNAAIEALGLIALRGKVVTGDALHCNRRTVEAINARGGDLCLALKGNQESLLSDARGCFSGTIDPRQQAMTEERGHGRNEVRKATVVSAKSLGEYHEFPGLKAFGRIEATREVDGKVTSETRYFALSWMPTPDILLTTVRDHWSIENALHWQLDVSFWEDAARNRKDNAPGNIAVLAYSGASAHPFRQHAPTCDALPYPGIRTPCQTASFEWHKPYASRRSRRKCTKSS